MRQVRRGRWPYHDQQVAASMPESGWPRQAAGGRPQPDTNGAESVSLKNHRFILLHLLPRSGMASYKNLSEDGYTRRRPKN